MSTSLGVVAQTDQFSDEALRQQVNELNIEVADATESERQSKRRKVSADSLSLSKVTTRLWHLLGVEPLTSLPDLKPILEYVYLVTCIVGYILLTYSNRTRFQELSESELCRIIDLLGYVCCAADDTLLIHEKKGDKFLRLDCCHCQAPQSSCEKSFYLDLATKQAVQGIFASLVQLPSFLESQKPRVTAMTAMRRIAKHCTDLDFLDIEISVTAQWCLKSLQSSVRELRIAAG